MRRPRVWEDRLRLAALLLLVGASMIPSGISAPGRPDGRGGPARHKILARRTPALDTLIAAGRIEVLDSYGPGGSALLVEGDGAAIDAARDASGRSVLRDVPDAIRLRSRLIDTSSRRVLAPARRHPGGRLELVQFHGPIKPEWLGRMRGAGRTRPIAYVPHNAYIVWTEDPDALSAAGLPLQWRETYSPGDRMSPDLVSTGDPVDVSIQVARAGDQEAVLQEIRGRALGILQEARDLGPLTTIRVTLPPGAAADLAGRDEVVWIEPFEPTTTHDEKSNIIVAGELNVDVPAGPGYLAWLDAHGLGDLGSILVDVTDTGIGNGSTSANHAGLQGRLVYSVDETGEGRLEDCPGHGTNIAGIIAGGAQPGNLIRDAGGYLGGLGMAPTVTVGATRIFDCTSVSPRTISYEKIVEDAYARGARISNNSWGGSGSQYNTVTAEYDALVRDANLDPSDGDHSLLPIFSAGNLGPQAYSVGWPATAKNVLTVGGSEGYRPGVSDGCGATSIYSDNANQVLSFSSRGPTADGRIKPDVVAPGSHIISLASNAPDYTGAGVCNRYYPPGQQVLNWASGTSQAAAHVSGAAAIALETYRRRFGADPSPAMLKAMLINHAHDLATTASQSSNTSRRPNTAQGWGRIDLSSLVESRARVAFDQPVIFGATGETVSYGPFAVEDPSDPVVITLVWTDAPGSPAGSAWVNDLDLSVEAGGQTYLGNVISQGFSIPGGAADYRNNVENVILSPGQSTFQVEVLAADIAGDGVPSNPGETDQDFALYVSNARLPAPVASISLQPDEPACGSPLDVTLESLRARGTGRATVVLSAGGDEESVILDESPPGLGVFRGAVDLTAGTSQPGDGRLQVTDAAPVTATYLQPDPATGVPVARTATATGRCSAPVVSDVRVTRSGAFEATVVWETDRPADSVVHFGAGANRNLEVSDARLVRDHRIRLTGLPPCSLISATVASTDAGGGTASGPATPLRFASGQSSTTRRVIFHDGMESIGSRWEHHAMRPGAVDDWQLGVPVTGIPGPPAGSQVWGTNLDGNYSVGADAVLVSPEIDLTGTLGGELTLLHYYSIPGGRSPFSENDGAWVEITADGGATWTTLEPNGGYPDTVDTDNPYLPAAAPVFAGALSTWSETRFDMSSFSGSVVRLRFHIWQDPGETVARSSGWYIDEVEVATQETCHLGSIALDSDTYGCSSIPEIRLTDTDLNRSASQVDTATVTVSSGSDQTAIQLRETGVNTGDFEGVIPLSAMASPGALVVSEGDGLSVIYDDRDTGDGTPATLTASAIVGDCTPPPAPAGVVASEDGAGRLDISWEPVDPAQAPDIQGYRVYYDTDGPGPSYSGTGALQGLSPVRAESAPTSLALTSLTPCTAHFIAVTAFDRFGNESPYSAETFAYPKGGAPCAIARMSLAPASPGCGDSIAVTVTDANADPDPGVPGTLTAVATSPSQPTPVSVPLRETAAASGVFVGSLALSATGLPGTLTVAAGDTVGIEYTDADDGTGRSGTTRQETTIVDCSPPVISDVRAQNVGADRATVTWRTDEPSDGVLDYGPDPSLGSVASDAGGLSMEHSVPVTSLNSCSPVYFTVTSTDAHGNSVTATDGGVPFRFGTAREITIYQDDFESGAPGWTHRSLGSTIDEWELGAPQGDGITAPATAFSGNSVFGTDLDGVYERAADIVLESPPIPLTVGDTATLVFRHWYDITSVGAPQGFDDGGFLEISDDDGATWAYIQPAPPGYPDIVTSNPYTPFGAGAYAGSTGAWVPATFILDDWVGRTVRLRFHLFQDVNDHNFVGQGWYIDDVKVLVSLACHDGRVWLDRAEYGCGGNPLLARITDADLNLDPLALDTATLTLYSDAEPAGEPLLLTEVTPDSGQFEGSLPISSTDAPGTLAVQDGDTIRAVYLDGDDGSGQTHVAVATAQVSDCAPPVISDVQVHRVTPDSLAVRWTTSEPSTGTVLFGTDPGYGDTVSSTALDLQHDLTVQGLAGCTDYYLTVASTDAAGNTTRDDALSGPRRASTASDAVLMHESFDAGAPGWIHEGQGDSWTFGPPVGFPSPSGPNVAGMSLATDYTRPPGPDNDDFVLVSPTFSLEGLDNPVLRFTHRYDFASNLAGRDGGRVEAWTGARWIPLAPVGGYPGVLDSAAGGGSRPIPGFTGSTQGSFVTSAFDLSGVLEAGRSITRIRFRVFVEGGVGATGRGWFIDDVTVSGALPCSIGTLAFQKDPITCSDASVDLVLHDRDLDTDPASAQQTQITVTSSSDPAPRAVTLTEDGASSGVFRGALALAPSGQAGALSVADGDVLTAGYQDADDGTGSPRNIVAHTLGASCVGPAIRDVVIAPEGSDAVVIRWSTDVPSTSLVSLSDGGLPRTAADFRLVTGHTLRLHGLIPCATYVATITSTDARGVTATRTGPQAGLVVEPPDRTVLFSDDMEGPDPGWTVSGLKIEWQRGTPLAGPPSAFSGSRVYATDLTGNYDGGTNSVLISPPIDLRQVSRARLTFWQWYDIFASDPPNSTDDSAWVEVQVAGASAPSYIEPIGGYPDTTDSEDGQPMTEGTPVYSGHTFDWDRAEFDLTPFAGKVIQLRFRIWNDLVELILNGVTGYGWYLDDVEVSSPGYCFAPPALTAVGAAPLTQGAAATGVPLSGSGFRSGATVSVGGGVTVSSLAYIAPDRLTVDLDVDPRAPLGSRSITVVNPDGQSTTLPGALQVTFSPARADINGSGRVDGTDLALLAGAFGADEGSIHYLAAADLNADGYVDGLDLALLASTFGSTFP